MIKKQKKFPVFYAVYFTLIVIFFITLAIALHIVRIYLADYESTQPQHEAQRVFDTYYATGDYSALIEASFISVSPLETKDSALNYLRQVTKDKSITYTRITTGLDSDIKYIVKADDLKFSSFTLTESNKKSEKGFTMYIPSSFEVYIAGTESVKVTAPLSYTVYINGVPLDETYLTGSKKEDISCQHMPVGVDGIIFAEYRADSLYFKPEDVKILSADGRECPLNQDENGNYSTGILYDNNLQAEYSEYVISAAQALAAYMQNDGKFSAISGYLDPESELYTNIRTSETYFVISHSSYSFEDVRSSEFCRYDDNTFSCRISFTHILKRSGSKDYRDYIDMTFFLRRVGDKFLIYDRYNH